MGRFLVVSLAALGVGFFAFQNCAPVEFGDSSKAQSLSCQQGPKKLGIWLDPNSDGETQAGEKYLGEIVTYTPSGPVLSGADNYNYKFDILGGLDSNPASGRPTYGPQPEAAKSEVFFYEGSDGLMLTVLNNINDPTNSASTGINSINFDMETSSNAKSDSIQLCDDPGSDCTDVSNSGSANRNYQFRFSYDYNTDGTVVGPFVGKDFKIKVRILNTGNIQDATFYSADGKKMSLNSLTLGGPPVSSFIIGWAPGSTICP